MEEQAAITVSNLTMAYGSFVLQQDLNFTVEKGDIFVIMGGSGCGKSTLLKHLTGLKGLSVKKLLDRRYEKFAKIGRT